MTSKRMIFHLHCPDIIYFISSLPRGYRSLVIESALMAYMQTEAGKTLVNQLQYRKDTKNDFAEKRELKSKAVLKKLKGDFD